MRRPDGVVEQQRIDDLQSKVKGHYVVKPGAYAQESLNGEDTLVELDDDAIRMVAQGWMCGIGGCLAMFTVPLVRCPCCGTPTGPHHIVSRARTPEEWAEHRKALAEQEPRDRLPSGPMSPDEWINRIVGNPEGDHTTISKLKKRRR